MACRDCLPQRFEIPRRAGALYGSPPDSPRDVGGLTGPGASAEQAVFAAADANRLPPPAPAADSRRGLDSAGMPTESGSGNYPQSVGVTPVNCLLYVDLSDANPLYFTSRAAFCSLPSIAVSFGAAPRGRCRRGRRAEGDSWDAGGRGGPGARKPCSVTRPIRENRAQAAPGGFHELACPRKCRVCENRTQRRRWVFTNSRGPGRAVRENRAQRRAGGFTNLRAPGTGRVRENRAH